MKWSVIVGLVALLGASDASAGQEGAGKANNPTIFLTHAAQDGEAEIELGKLAQEKAADAKVKDFGARRHEGQAREAAGRRFRPGLHESDGRRSHEGGEGIPDGGEFP